MLAVRTNFALTATCRCTVISAQPFLPGGSSYCMSGEVVTAQNRTRGRLQNGFHPRDGVGFAWHWHAWITLVSNTQRWHQAAASGSLSSRVNGTV